MTSTTTRTLAAGTLVLCIAAIAVPAGAAMPDSWTSKTFRLHASAGSCPASLTIASHARPYEGGAAFETTAQTQTFAVAPHKIASTAGHVEFFSAALRPAYATCELKESVSDNGITVAVTLHHGTMRLRFTPTPEVQIMGAGVSHGNPTLKTAVAD